MDTSDLAKRIKDYEMRDRYFLQKRIPVAIRVDMRAGHTFTRGFERPFDDIFMKSMQETAKYMCENMGNAKFAYVQSDEITLILVDYQTLTTEAWFDYRVEKLCSISASMATMAFNKFFYENVFQYNGMASMDMSNKEYPYKEIYAKAIEKGAMFDARCFNIPKEEVTNLIYWRQLDASRNSVQMVGQAYFSQKELQDKSCNDIKDMLMTKGVNWNDLPTYQKRGTCVIKEEYYPKPVKGYENCEVNALDVRTRWVIDKEIPIFKGEGREYIDKLVYVGD